MANVLDRKNLLFTSQSVAFPYDKYPQDLQTQDGGMRPLSSDERNLPRAFNTFSLQVFI